MDGAHLMPVLPFALNPAFRVIACKRVAEGSPVLNVSRGASPFDWQFLCGGNEHDDVDEAVQTHLHHLTETDSTLRALGTLPLNCCAVRESQSDEWTPELLPGVEGNGEIHPFNPECIHCQEIRDNAPRDTDGYLPSERAVFENVTRQGFHVASILPSSDHDGWSYSIGLFKTYGHPEVVVFGQKVQWQVALVCAIADNIKSGARYSAQTRDGSLIPPDYEVEFRAVGCSDWYPEIVGQALWYYERASSPEHTFPLLQVVWPDLDRRFPWDTDYDGYIQPVLV